MISYVNLYLIILSFSCFTKMAGEPLIIAESIHSQEAFSYYEKADDCWETYQDEIRWFIKYQKPDDDPQDSEPNEEDLRIRKKERQDYLQMVETIALANNQFLYFRDRVAESLAAPYNSNAYAASIHALAIFELTKWYTNYMQENLFPSNWPSLYKLQSLASTSNSNSEASK